MRRLFYTAAMSIFVLLNGPHVLAQQLTSDCPPNGEAQHWDMIIFNVKLAKNQSHVIPPEFLGVNLDLKILDPPGTIVNLDQEVRAALAERFTLTDFDADLLKIKIIDVKYQIVTCASTGPQGPPGVQGPPGPPGEILIVSSPLPQDFNPGTTTVSVSCPDTHPTAIHGYLGWGPGNLEGTTIGFSPISGISLVMTAVTCDVTDLFQSTPNPLLCVAICST